MQKERLTWGQLLGYIPVTPEKSELSRSDEPEYEYQLGQAAFLDMNSLESRKISKPDGLVDGFDRRLNYLRISITDRCNLNCLYCMPTDRIPKLTHVDILRYEEILRVVRIAVGLGISKIRVTGGEPLMRKGVYEFLARLSAINGITDLALTTNGLLLKENVERLKTAGVRRLNVSLDTLDASTYHRITGHPVFQKVWEGILAAHEAGFFPIKLNVVALKGINDHELSRLGQLSFAYPFHIRFIEQMPIGGLGIHPDPPLLAGEIKQTLEKTLGPLTPVRNSANDGPARRYRFQNARGEIGFISPLSNHFCEACNRLRLTASGRIRACLLSDEQTDLKEPMRAGCTDSRLVELMLSAVAKKPQGHGLTPETTKPIAGHMSAIGG
ncbi:MAG: GTP 3',8-cyclase MoaA [Thermodesulfobacteriota bacterium]